MKKRVLSAMLVAAMAMTALPSQTFCRGIVGCGAADRKTKL